MDGSGEPLVGQRMYSRSSFQDSQPPNLNRIQIVDIYRQQTHIGKKRDINASKKRNGTMQVPNAARFINRSFPELSSLWISNRIYAVTKGLESFGCFRTG